ncbi:unnamed protein product, partial [Hydatigera taeniaeformis]|uniref:Clathrin light chain n=1 Tax=Hydatigena taeniaeformis TaxID=6205 RepID=A0A0R3XAI7_HYDTA
MASEPLESSNNMPHLGTADQSSRMNSFGGSGIDDFISPDFEFDQFETELAATKVPDDADSSDAVDRISPEQYVEEDFEAELGCTAAQ